MASYSHNFNATNAQEDHYCRFHSLFLGEILDYLPGSMQSAFQCYEQ